MLKNANTIAVKNIKIGKIVKTSKSWNGFSVIALKKRSKINEIQLVTNHRKCHSLDTNVNKDTPTQVKPIFIKYSRYSLFIFISFFEYDY
ncbi:MAG TPA: hypothetical protein PKW94_01500 [Candidatus Dojkabacteria bacterium]|nr:hypothetical protein [Candidatus Dojkabacteria bacterium]HOT60959.1 hypothetical protein [Candidatus Dojkabacteria bacterium]HQI92465.1 hypothetical protein [Candidatus Dojkabacteria bacterium]